MSKLAFSVFQELFPYSSAPVEEGPKYMIFTCFGPHISFQWPLFQLSTILGSNDCALTAEQQNQKHDFKV